jgi:hypothetical protein
MIPVKLSDCRRREILKMNGILIDADRKHKHFQALNIETDMLGCGEDQVA